jgi:hypothetical protein
LDTVADIALWLNVDRFVVTVVVVVVVVVVVAPVVGIVMC